MNFLNIDWDSYKKTADQHLKKAWVRITLGISGYLILRKVYDIIDRKWNNYPPGYIGYPLIGCGLDYFLHSRQYLTHLATHFGPICMIYIGKTPTIVINDYFIAKEYFNKQLFSNRLPVSRSLFKVPSFLKLNWDQAKPRRDLMLHSLIDQAQRTNNLYQLIGKSIEIDLFKVIDNCINKNIKWGIRKDINYISFCAIYSSMFGEYIDINDKEFIQFVEKQMFFMENLGKTFAINSMLPDGKRSEKYINSLPAMQALATFRNILNKWTQKQIDRINHFNVNQNESKKDEQLTLHNTTTKTGDNCKKPNMTHQQSDYIAKLLDFEKTNKITRESMIADIDVSFFAGSHTTSVAAEQCILYLAKYPQLQQEMYHEIKTQLVSTNYQSRGSVKHYKQCVHLTAFIYEVLRHHGMVTSCIDRGIVLNGSKTNTIAKQRLKSISKKLQLGNERVKIEFINKKTGLKQWYNLPKRCNVTANLHAIMNDHQTFPNYDKFDPTQWLKVSDSNDINCNTNDNNLKSRNAEIDTSKTWRLVAFGIGRRRCVGEALAKNILYLLLGLLIEKYKFRIPDEFIDNESKYQIPTNYTKPNVTVLGVKCELRVEIAAKLNPSNVNV